MTLGRFIRFSLLAILLLIGGAASFVFYVLMYGGAPMTDGARLGDGKVTLILDHMGPIRIAAYLIDLDGGRYALVDTGLDPEAKAIVAALRRRGATAGDVRDIFLTHAHDDHSGGARAFPNATVFASAVDANWLRGRGLKVQDLSDGAQTALPDAPAEAFATPGHTAGSMSYLIHGVLFVGDAAASISDTALSTNDFAYTANVEENHRSLRALAARLEPRADAVQDIAFGHQGPLKGLGPLLRWAAETGKR